MTLWVLMGLMCLTAISMVALPLYRESKRLTPTLAAMVIVLAALSTGLYAYQGSPDVPSGRGTDARGGAQSMNDAIASLAARLSETPDDVEGWIMLGRSYLSVQDFGNAVDAFERAVALEESGNAQTLVNLAEALLARDNAPIEGRTATLFETAVNLDPTDQKALFYSGIAAANRGDVDVAMERWERLSALNPPPEIQDILARQLAEWRGEPAPEPQAQPAVDAEPEPVAPAQGDAVVTANIMLSGDAAAALTSEAIVFIIARDPAQPSPPIAVTRRLLSQLPTEVSLSDAESMVEGRNLSSFEEFEILVRVSLSGQPVAQPGDWFAVAQVRPSEQQFIDMTIDQRVE